ncbi:MAG: aminotransferase class IV [Hyphomicrobium sp.]|jgi:branched-subunit amino acid aminotransferase/4-amino-4-deoxychorismate lyase
MTRQTETGAADWNDRAVLYGYGLFETMRVYRGVPFVFDAHLDRLEASLSSLALNRVPNRVAYRRDVLALAASLDEGAIRLMVTAGNPDMDVAPTHHVAVRALPYSPRLYATGATVCMAREPRNELSMLCRHKTLNQLQNIIEWQAAVKAGSLDCLFLNTTGHLAEGSRSNVFIVKQGRLITPSLSCGILPGIARLMVLDLARQAGLFVTEAPVTTADLFSSDECFLTNSLAEVLPVRQIGTARPQHCPGPITSLLAQRYRQCTDGVTPYALPSLLLSECGDSRT